MSKNNNKIYLVKSSEEYFLEEFNRALEKTGYLISDELKMYMLKLLSKNILQNSDMDLDKPLAIQFLESLNEPTNICQRKLKAIADYTLYLSGYFAESFNKKIIDVDYYSKIGMKAYAELYNLIGESCPVYYELYYEYYKLLEILTEISFHTMHTGTRNLLKMYDRWLVTGSCVLEKKLNEKGIITEYKKPKVA